MYFSWWMFHIYVDWRVRVEATSRKAPSRSFSRGTVGPATGVTWFVACSIFHVSVQHFKHFIRCGTAPVPPHPQFKRVYNIVQVWRIASNVFVRYHCNALEIIIHEWMRKQAPGSVQLSWYPQNGELIRTKMVNSTKIDHNNPIWVLIFRQLYIWI
mgnify:CR=1 FL=1